MAACSWPSSVGWPSGTSPSGAAATPITNLPASSERERERQRERGVAVLSLVSPLPPPSPTFLAAAPFPPPYPRRPPCGRRTPRDATPTPTPPPSPPPPPVSAPADIPAIDGPAALAILGGGSVMALAAAFSLADPERCRRLQAEGVGGGDKEVVKDYFNNTGFERWKKIYGGSTEGVNRVQLDIRLGHARTVESALAMLRDGGPLAGVTVCDAGCGTGSLAIPLAREGAVVSASDISGAMVAEAQRRAEEALGGAEAAQMPKFEVKDLESLQGGAGSGGRAGARQGRPRGGRGRAGAR